MRWAEVGRKESRKEVLQFCLIIVQFEIHIRSCRKVSLFSAERGVWNIVIWCKPVCAAVNKIQFRILNLEFSWAPCVRVQHTVNCGSYFHTSISTDVLKSKNIRMCLSWVSRMWSNVRTYLRDDVASVMPGVVWTRSLLTAAGVVSN